MLINIVHTVSLFVGYFFIVVFLLESISLIVLRYFRFESPTKELRGAALMNPLFEKSDSYDIRDTWRQQYNAEIGEIFKSSTNQALNKWQPLGLWSAPRYHGNHINIDKYNLRRTIAAGRKNFREAKLRIYCFGGSQVWGWGVRDENTIPSQLMHLRNDAFIENHGQLGYVSSQSVIAFIQTVKYRPKPNIVIFIDGLNDVYSAYQSGIAGIEQNAISRKQRSELKSPEGIGVFEFYRKKSNFINFMNSVFRNGKTKNVSNSKDRNELLAHSVISAYNQNVLLVNKIASAYNFKAIFIWLPTIFDKPNLTKYELKVLDMVKSCKPLYASIKKITAAGDIFAPQVYNLSNFFYNNKEPIYADPWHFNERANFLIAEKINELIASDLPFANGLKLIEN